MAPPTVSPFEQLAIAAKLGLSVAQVTTLGKALGLSPDAVWRWLKEKLKEPGDKIPRPGKGLPGFDVPGWAVMAVVGYILWKWD